jgi:hypothetical protein
MKGYTEHRGLASKLEYDEESGRFVSKPISHVFAPGAEPNFVLQKLADWRARREQRKACHQLNKELAEMSPQLRNDMGMTNALVATQALRRVRNADRY